MRLTFPIVSLEGVYGEVRGARGDRHIGKGWVLGGRRGHTGPVRYEDIFAGMKLVPFIEQGGLWIMSHADAAHFMNIEAGRLMGVVRLNIGESRLCEHFRHLLEEILDHLFFVVR